MSFIAFLRKNLRYVEWGCGVIPSIIAALWMALNIPSSPYAYWVFTWCSLIFVLVFIIERRMSFLLLNTVYSVINIIGLFTRHWT